MKLLRRVRWSLVGAAAFFARAGGGSPTAGRPSPATTRSCPTTAHPAANVVHAPGGKPPADGIGLLLRRRQRAAGQPDPEAVGGAPGRRRPAGARQRRCWRRASPTRQRMHRGRSGDDQLAADRAGGGGARAGQSTVPIEQLGAQLLASRRVPGRQGRPQAGRHRDRRQRRAGAHGGRSDRGHAAGQAGAVRASDAEAGRERHAHHRRQHRPPAPRADRRLDRRRRARRPHPDTGQVLDRLRSAGPRPGWRSRSRSTTR